MRGASLVLRPDQPGAPKEEQGLEPTATTTTKRQRDNLLNDLFGTNGGVPLGMSERLLRTCDVALSDVARQAGDHPART